MRALLPRYWGDPALGEKVEAATRGYDHVFVGSSRTFRQLDPALFDRAMAAKGMRTRSFNMGRPGLVAPDLYLVLEDLMQRSPRGTSFIVEFSPLLRMEREHLKDRRFWYSLDPAIAARLVAHTLRLPLAPSKMADNLGNLLTAAVRSWFMIGLGAGSGTTVPENSFAYLMGANGLGHRTMEDEVDLPGGQTFLLQRRAELLADTMQLRARADFILKRASAADNGLPATYHAQWLERLRRGAKERGHELVFVLPPLLTSDVEDIDATSATLPTEELIDLRDPERFPEFYTMAFTFDVGHLNKRGAALYTNALADAFVRSVRDPAIPSVP